MVFLEDCYLKTFLNPLGALQGPQPPGKVAKSVEVEKDLPTQGLDQLDLKFLPHYTLRDIRKRKVLSWEDGRFVEVLRPGQKPCDESWAAGLTEAVCRLIEARSLLFPKNIEVFRENGFPWMRQLLQRLSPRMADKERIIVLTFLSCVGMLMRGEYVVYEHLKSLLAELPIPQSKMVKMRIQVGFQVTQEEELRMADWNEPDCKKAFLEYIRRCTEASVTCRSYSAFKMKMSRGGR
ncbi:unnamed protein product [Boreogadus saida]